MYLGLILKFTYQVYIYIWYTQISVQTEIGIHWHYNLKSQSNLRVFSNRSPFKILTSIGDLLVRIRVRAYLSDVIARRLEKVRNGYRFENWTLIWSTDVCDVEIRHGFEDWTSIWVLHIYIYIYIHSFSNINLIPLFQLQIR